MIPVTLCTNMECTLRLACERANREPSDDQEYESFNPEGKDVCPGFIVRESLGGANPDIVFTASRRPGRGKRHNAHAPPRSSYPGSEALFGQIFGKGNRKNSTGAGHSSSGSTGRVRRLGEGADPNTEAPKLPKKPDLMVTRHVHKGRNIKGEDRGD